MPADPRCRRLLGRRPTGGRRHNEADAHRKLLFRRTAMDITLETASLDKLRAGVLVVGAFADGTLPPSARAVDEASKGKLSAVIKRGDLGVEAGSALLLHDLPGIAAERVLTVSLGKRDDAGDKTFRHLVGSVARALPSGPGREDAAG